jgi:DNA mismatch endonuclease (patch repair protein)
MSRAASIPKRSKTYGHRSRQNKIGAKAPRADRLTKERRSWNMSRIRGKNTTPEIRVRALLHRLGFRFRIHQKNLPGQPDIVLSKYNAVIFVHGCFWHRHKGCKNCTTPTNRREWWLAKLNGNAARDKLHQAALRNIGWRILVVWECQAGNARLEQRLCKFLRADV